MNSKERIAYLRGLLDSLPKEERETKIYSAMADSLESLALELEEHSNLLKRQREDYDNLAEEMDELHETMYELEESFGLEDSDDENYDDDDDVEEIGSITESYISMICPSCAYSFYYKYEGDKENDRLICPSCGEEFSRTL